jgi:hypothetical protein
LWKTHERRFPNVPYVAPHVLDVLGSQIETKHNFSIARMLTSLWVCKLRVDNLNKLVMIIKKWLKDARIEYTPKSNPLISF